MCWFPFFQSSNKKRKKPSSNRSSRDRPLSEKTSLADESISRRTRPQHPPAQTTQYGSTWASSPSNPPLRTRKPKLRVDVPSRPQRRVYHHHPNSSSTEMLLNPRPDRPRRDRQRHPKSTTTLRGRGAKRDPPTSKSKKTTSTHQKSASTKPRHRSSSTSTSSSTKRRRRHPPPPSQYQHPYQYQPQPQPQPAPSQYQYAYHQPQPYHYHPRPRDPQPNTSARRLPDGRFAVRAATNQALEDIRREAFLASPRPRAWGAYHGAEAVYTTETPFHWDCVTVSSDGRRRRR